MTRRIPLLLTAIYTLTAAAAVAANKWEDMDYGRFLSATYLNPEGMSTLDGKGSCTNKGIAIKLGKTEAQNAEGTLLFDTELLRMAGGWTGGWIKLKGVTFDGGHGPNPSPKEGANIYFETNPGPGWSKGEDLTDPRKLPTGPGAAKVPFGPLPKEWAKYKGLYLSGDNVVLAYTVGTASVLEMPALEKSGEIDLLTRTFNVVAPGAASNLLIADGVEGTTAVVEGGLAFVSNEIVNPDNRLVVGLVGAPAGAKFVASGARVTLHLPAFAAGQAFKVAFGKCALPDAPKVTAAINALAKPADLKQFTKGGAPHWPEVAKTAGTLGTDDKSPYVVDTLTVPFENAAKSWFRIAGVDFFKDGRMAVSTWSGDVWIVSGIDAKLENLQWKRYATGLFQALGLKIVDDVVYVLGRDQITRLHDLNADGEADLYENFNNDVQVTPGFHEFTFGLETDRRAISTSPKAAR